MNIKKQTIEDFRILQIVHDEMFAAVIGCR